MLRPCENRLRDKVCPFCKMHSVELDIDRTACRIETVSIHVHQLTPLRSVAQRYRDSV